MPGNDLREIAADGLMAWATGRTLMRLQAARRGAVDAGWGIRHEERPPRGAETRDQPPLARVSEERL